MIQGNGRDIIVFSIIIVVVVMKVLVGMMVAVCSP